MDEMLMALVLRRVSLGTSLIGILVGIDMLCGARVIIAVKKILDRAYNFDNTVVRPKIRVWVGVSILFVSLLMILLLATTK